MDAAGGGQHGELAANVAVAEPTATARVIAAWPSFALISSNELLMRQIHATATLLSSDGRAVKSSSVPKASLALTGGTETVRAAKRPGPRHFESGLRRKAWEWAVSNRSQDGKLPSGKAIADQFGRHERWGRLVKRYGIGDGADVGAQGPAA
jgi:hypothetical protein